MPLNPIIVPPNGNCADHREDPVSRNSVFWYCPAGRNFTVHFTSGSPFVGGQTDFPSAAGVTAASQIDRSAGLGTYPYEVTFQGVEGVEVKDPKIILNSGGRPPLLKEGATLVAGLALITWALVKIFGSEGAES